MGRGNGKGERKKRTRKRDQTKHKQIKLSSWLGISSTVELCPNPEDRPAKNARKKLRWIHAGIYQDNQYNLQDIWYAFEPHKKYKYKICYARDGVGTRLGNHGVGQIKRNLITFDEHHVDKWRHRLNYRGTWIDGSAKAGRREQRTTLLKTYLDRSFVDPYPDGRRVKVLSPPLNVIHDRDDKSGSGPARIPRNTAANAPPLDPDDAYPGSNIPLSTADIQVDAFRNINEDSFKVISDFLTGRLQDGHRERQNRSVQVDRIESAFYDRGYRVNRRAVLQALQDMHEDPGSSAFESDALQQDPPLRVDQFKGEDVQRLISTLIGKGPPQGSDSDNDSANDQQDNLSDDDDLENPLFVSRKLKQRPKFQPKQRGGTIKSNKNIIQHAKNMMAAHKSSSLARSSREDSSDGFEYISDDSPLKGKGPARRKGESQEIVGRDVDGQETTGEVQNEALEAVQDNGYVELNEDRSTPAPPPREVKSESPIILNRWENAIVIVDDSELEDDPDVEFLEERVVPKKEPLDGVVDMTMVDDDDDDD